LSTIIISLLYLFATATTIHDTITLFLNKVNKCFAHFGGDAGIVLLAKT